jgi:hypothetical protein
MWPPGRQAALAALVEAGAVALAGVAVALVDVAAAGAATEVRREEE